MSTTAAERIVIDDDVLHSQLTTLRSAADQLKKEVASAANQIGSNSFGSLNAFLAAAVNGMMLETSATMAEAAVLAERMHAGVSGAREAFSTFEDEVASSFKGLIK